MMRTIVIYLLALTFLIPCDAVAERISAPDSLQLIKPEINNKLITADLFLLTLGVWSPSYLLGVEWAKIGFNSVEANLEAGFIWDHDDWYMNQWGHPMHGGQFYNAARSNGHDFWGSIPYAFTGSMAWELFMEAENPSLNDLLTTVTGGIYMGETAYRLSSMVLDNTATGSERTFREIGGFMINPIRGFNRLVTGKSGKVFQNPADRMPNYLGGQINAGTNHVADGTDLGSAKTAYLLKLKFLYGNPFDSLADPVPFEYFTLNASLNLYGKFPFIHEVFGMGLICGRKFDHGEDNRSLFGIFQDYDYFDNIVYQFGGQSVGPGIISRFNAESPLMLVTGAQLNAIVLAGSNVGFETEEGREYNYNTGLKLKLFGELRHKKYGTMGIRYWGYWFHTISGIDGDEFVHFAQANINPRIYEKWGLGMEYTYYVRNSFLDDYPETHMKNIELRTFVSYRF